MSNSDTWNGHIPNICTLLCVVAGVAAGILSVVSVWAAPNYDFTFNRVIQTCVVVAVTSGAVVVVIRVNGLGQRQ